ncbi:hypothetical protein PSTT_06370 [Puccinia striiformis]|uniref:Uncharacterized protein n=1 Tax=Puccinia striiformis TaxID=27350 RepID=A0A2S4VKL6_9BASI|nr:hypothetical protein PSTT_06370 [Puccinia striiformis]
MFAQSDRSTIFTEAQPIPVLYPHCRVHPLGWIGVPLRAIYTHLIRDALRETGLVGRIPLILLFTGLSLVNKATKLRHNDQFFRVSRLPSSSSVQATEIDFMGILDKPVVSDPLWGKLEQSRVYNGMKSLAPSGTSDKFSEPQLNLELALHPMGTFAKKRKVTSSGPGVVTDIMSGWILREKSHGNKANSEPHLDLGLALNHPSASDKKRKHPAATPIMEAEVMNEWRSRARPDKGIPIHTSAWRATAERSLVPPPPETVHEGIAKKQDRPSEEKELLQDYQASKGPSRIPNRSEQFPKSQEKSQAIENSRKRKNTENRALEKEENHEKPNGKRVSEREEREKVLVTPAPKRNSRSKQADPKMRAMFHGSHTDKIWAWIFAGTAYVAEPSDLELKGEMNLKFTTELASKMNEINQQDRDSLSNVISSSEVHENVTQFIDLLLLTNLRWLRGFGTVSRERCIEELNLLHKWLLVTLTKERIQPSTHRAQRNWHVFPGVSLKQVVDSVIETLNSRKTNTLIYRMIRKETVASVYMGVFSESQLMMTKTVVTLLAAYYKKSNSAKWKALFRSEGTFLSRLAKLQSPHIKMETKKIAEDYDLLPWKAKPKQSRKSTKISLKASFRAVISKKWDDWVVPFNYNEWSAVVGDDVWATISLIQRGRHKIILRDSDSLNPMLSRFDPRGSNLSPAISKMYDDDKIDYERVKYLVTSVWVLNSRLIEACGYTTEEPEYLEEQIHLQDEMFKILNHPRDQAELSGSSKSKGDPSSTEKVLSDSIFSALRCKITSKTYRSTFKTIQITLSKQDTTMAEAAVRMIAYHYQKKNIVKWFNLFKDEDGFINCFQRIAFRIRTMKSLKAFLSTAFISIREIQLLPWKDAMYTTAKQRLLHAHVFRRKQYLD